MINEDLDWLAAQQPQHIGIDGGARERALLSLIQHTTSHPARRGVRFNTRFGARTLGACFAGAATVALGLAVATGGLGAGGATVTPRDGAPLAAVSAHHHGAGATGSPLARLAAYVNDSTPTAGDATLVQRTTITGGKTITVYDLYGDNGEYFFSPQESGLAAQVSANNNQGQGVFAREVAAAKAAATGSVDAAAQQMADAPDPSHVISKNQPSHPAILAAKLKALGKPVPSNLASIASSSLYDNWVWENSQDAIIAGASQPSVRAGVLKILATLPGVTVTSGTYQGQPTLVLTAGTQELGAGYQEQLTINSDTGMPIQFTGGQPGAAPATTVDYGVQRVTLANIASGAGN